jgi:hypothetical protein
MFLVLLLTLHPLLPLLCFLVLLRLFLLLLFPILRLVLASGVWGTPHSALAGRGTSSVIYQ